MAQGRLRVLRTVPSSTHLGPLLADFGRRGEGVVTAFSDSALPIARRFVGEDQPVEVKPFGELVSGILRLCGESVLPLAQRGHLEAAIGNACHELPAESPFVPSAKTAGGQRAILRTLRQLHQWDLDADAIEALADGVNPRLGQKLRGLALLDRNVRQTLHQLGRQSHAEQVWQCLDSVPETDGAVPRLLVLAGSEEHPLRVSWLKWAIRQGVDVTVIVDRHAADGPLFAGADRTVAALGVEPTSFGDGNIVTRNLFLPDSIGGQPVQVGIESAADPLAEAEWAIRAVAQTEPPENAAIYVRNLTQYAPLLEAAAARLNVPIRINRRAPLLTNAFAQLTLRALEFCAGSDTRALEPILRSSYLGLNGAAQRELRQALRDAHAMRALQWSMLERWAEANAERFGWIQCLLSWRRTALTDAYSLRDWYGLLQKLINDPDLPWSTRRESGDRLLIERDRRARNQMERALANEISVALLGDPAPVPLGSIAETCRRTWSDSDVSIPAGETGVLVTDQVEALHDVEHLQVLGMLEGVFPRRRQEDPILTDAERAEISRQRPDHPALPDSHVGASAERDAFYRVCAAARSSLVCSYPIADDERDNIRAFYLTELERAAETVRLENRRRSDLAPQESALRADQALREALAADRVLAASVRLETETAREALQHDPASAYRPKELRDVLRCPFQAAMRHRLNLDVRRPSTRWHHLRRLPQAAGLTGQPDIATADRTMRAVLDAELDRLYSEIESWERQMLSAGGRRLVRDAVRREFLAREVWNRRKEDTQLDVPFGDPLLRNALPGSVTLRGTVPAVSILGGYTVVHLNERAPSKATVSTMQDHEKLYLGVHMLAAYHAERESAVEFDGLDGKRVLVLLSRATPVNQQPKAGLVVVDLCPESTPTEWRRAFYQDVKALIKRARERLDRADIAPTPGEHCDRCDFGELCRRASGWGESDSLFDFPEDWGDA